MKFRAVGYMVGGLSQFAVKPVMIVRAVLLHIPAGIVSAYESK